MVAEVQACWWVARLASAMVRAARACQCSSARVQMASGRWKQGEACEARWESGCPPDFRTLGPTTSSCASVDSCINLVRGHVHPSWPTPRARTRPLCTSWRLAPQARGEPRVGPLRTASAFALQVRSPATPTFTPSRVVAPNRHTRHPRTASTQRRPHPLPLATAQVCVLCRRPDRSTARFAHLRSAGWGARRTSCVCVLLLTHLVVAVPAGRWSGVCVSVSRV